MTRKTIAFAALATMIGGCSSATPETTKQQRGNLEASSHYDDGYVLVTDVHDRTSNEIVLSLRLDPAVGTAELWTPEGGTRNYAAKIRMTPYEANELALGVHENAIRDNEWLDGNVDYQSWVFDSPMGAGCSPGDWGDECQTACCDDHDQCYRDCGCTLPGPLCRLLNPWFDVCLGICDATVAGCLFDCWWES